jgi:ABC-type nitrate/sulfonate/bicarbonate transport system permease component
MFAMLIVLGTLGALLDALVSSIGRRLVHWQQA